MAGKIKIAYFGHGRVGEEGKTVLQWIDLDLYPPEEADIWISVHWPHLFTKAQITTPKLGILNLHNSYLPWNRGAHACSWAIVDGTPKGATLHWVDGGIDTGPIFFQKEIITVENETASDLYLRTKSAEMQVLRLGVEMVLAGGPYPRHPQKGKGTYHNKKDLKRLLLALYTNDWEEMG